MSQIDQLIKDLHRHSYAVKKCAHPLAHLGVTCFYYVSIKNNGDYLLLTDCPEVDEYYFDQKLYINDPYIRHPSNYQSGFFLFETNQKEEFDQSLAFLARNFQMTPLIGLCERHKDSVEFYGFWGKSDRRCSFDQVYLNYASLLKAFVSYFKQECAAILKSDSIPYLSLSDLIGTDFINNKRGQENKLNPSLIRKYLTDMGLKDIVEKADLLSMQESQCVKLLLKGKSAKETAAILNLSFRTVEHYLENIKNKFKCQYKNEIFDIAEQLNELSLI